MEVIERIDDMAAISNKASLEGRAIIFIPTMGALHAGHAALIEEARALDDSDNGLVVLSVFVNPTQFGVGEDLADYPRPIEADKEIAEAAGVDIFFMPKAEDIYPEGFITTVDVDESLSSKLCGKARPGHFEGVATVVTKLFNIVKPETAVFGLKDYQQLLIIRRITADLNLGVDIVGVETVRDADGLAMSSRNDYLSVEERRAALVIPRALELARRLFCEGETTAARIRDKVLNTIEKEPLVVVEYLELCDPLTLMFVPNVPPGTFVAIAVRVGKTRLIDNCILP